MSATSPSPKSHSQEAILLLATELLSVKLTVSGVQPVEAETLKSMFGTSKID